MKKLIAIALVFAMLLSLTVNADFSTHRRPGDVTGNGNIELEDALEILKYVVGINSVIDNCEVSFNAARITGDGKPGIGDAIEILKHLVGMEGMICNEPPRIVFVRVNTRSTYDNIIYIYDGLFVESNGNVRAFYIKNDECWVFWGSTQLEWLNKTKPQEKLLSYLYENISEFEFVENIPLSELNFYTNLLPEIDINIEVTREEHRYSMPYDGWTGFMEFFGVRYDDKDNAQIVYIDSYFGNAWGGGGFINPDENFRIGLSGLRRLLFELRFMPTFIYQNRETSEGKILEN
jgi:hypothetical protein